MLLLGLEPTSQALLPCVYPFLSALLAPHRVDDEVCSQLSVLRFSWAPLGGPGEWLLTPFSTLMEGAAPSKNRTGILFLCHWARVA